MDPLVQSLIDLIPNVGIPLTIALVVSRTVWARYTQVMDAYIKHLEEESAAFKVAFFQDRPFETLEAPDLPLPKLNGAVSTASNHFVPTTTP